MIPALQVAKPTGTVTKAVAFFEKKWTQWGKSPAGSFNQRIHSYGTKLLDKLEEEEAFLKNIPKLEALPSEKVELVLDTTSIPESQLVAHLKTLAQERIPIHRKRAALWVLAIPFSMAFAIVPGPNLPLAYNLFRLYSNYQAYHGAISLQHVLQHQQYMIQHDEGLKKWVDTHIVKCLSEVPDKAIDELVSMDIGGEHLSGDMKRWIRKIEKGLL